jgi:hypothetical protein
VHVPFFHHSKRARTLEAVSTGENYLGFSIFALRIFMLASSTASSVLLAFRPLL